MYGQVLIKSIYKVQTVQRIATLSGRVPRLCQAIRILSIRLQRTQLELRTGPA